MIASISTSDVRIIGVTVLVLGIGSLLVVGWRYRSAWLLAALGASLSTWGSLLL